MEHRDGSANWGAPEVRRGKALEWAEGRAQEVRGKRGQATDGHGWDAGGWTAGVIEWTMAGDVALSVTWATAAAAVLVMHALAARFSASSALRSSAIRTNIGPSNMRRPP